MESNAILFWLITWIILSLVVGSIGKNRRIGFGRAFAVAFFFSPIIGIVVASLSRNLEDIDRDIDILNALKKLNGEPPVKEKSKDRSSWFNRI